MDEGAALPPATAFIARVGGPEYFWVGSRAWQDIPERERVYFTSEEEAQEKGYTRAPFTFEDLDEFEMLNQIGEGGTSMVYRARDRALGRDVAIKVIHSTFGTDPETTARFAQEARLLAGLRHPGIVAAFAVKRMRGGGLALVMEYVSGPTLREVIRREGPLEIDRAEKILRDIAGALIAAHEHGIVHRDVKPDNIFLEEETGRALLADFGIAMNLHNPSGLTMAGTTIGTPNYMSPEQIDGQRIDRRSDLYSLGLIGWEMLTGQKPWDGETLYSVIYKQKREYLPSLRTLRPEVPRRLAFAIEGTLGKSPDERWNSVEVFLEQLSDESLSARWRHWSSPLLGGKRALTRIVRPGAMVPSPSEFKTVAFRREGGVEMVPYDPVHPVPYASQQHRRHWFRLSAAVLVLMVVVAAGAFAMWRLPGVSVFGGGGSPEEDAVGQADQVVASGGPPAYPVLDSSALGPGGVYGGLSNDGLVGIDSAAALGMQPPAGALAGPLPNPLVPGAPGTPGTDTTAVDARLPVARDAARIAAGGMHSCEIDSRGTLFCWGGNDRGQLGSNVGERLDAPRRIDAASGFTSVTAGAFHSCALSSEGVALCWGDNRYGQVGDVANESSPPIRVTENRFYSLALGAAHSCGLARDGRVYCWGSNGNGQLGNGNRNASSEPVRVQLEGEIASVAAGWNHTCAITRLGQIACWGQNGSGQLGDGRSADRTTPALLPGDRRYRALTAGSAHTCALSVDGEAFCWGENSDGRLGDGGTASRSTPTRVATTQRFVEISAGGRHTCGRTANGTAFCWGQNNYGQLGIGNTQGQVIPARVETSVRFSSIRSSGSHTCGLGVDEATYCWGYNIEGQVGDGSRSHRTTPQRVEPLTPGSGL